jgi:predicted alpha-1,2-mannosidase
MFADVFEDIENTGETMIKTTTSFIAYFFLIAFANRLMADDLARWVDPFIGTAGGGETYPAAQFPFGMISPGPNTAFADYGGIDSRPGFDFSGKQIVSFALTHISGVGLHAAQDLPFMPCVGTLDRSPVGNRQAYQSAYTGQKAEPGYYQATLTDPAVSVAMAAAPRAAIVTMNYPARSDAGIIFCPSNCGTAISNCSLDINTSGNEISGWADSGDFNDAPFRPERWAYRIYFVAQFDIPILHAGVWQGATRQDGTLHATGTNAAAYVQFDCTKQQRATMRIAISYVSVDGARKNLAAEIPGWDLDHVRTAARDEWNNILGKIRVGGGSDDLLKSFYTAIYHNALQPNVFDDVDGQYIGFDNKTHRVEAGHHVYANFSLWDTYRSTAALQAMLVPDRASDMVQSLLLDSVQCDGGLPIWPINNNDTGCMGTYPADPFIASVYAFGGRGFDLKLAHDRMVLTATKRLRCKTGGDWAGLEQYIQLGWQPNSASGTLEYAVDDFGIAQICRAAGDETQYRAFMAMSANAFNVFDPSVGYMRGRRADGTWVTPFSTNTQRGFEEGCSAQYTWMTPINYTKLIELLGGHAKAESRLDEFFNPMLIGGWRPGNPHYWLGNEPTMETPYIYNWMGTPWKTQSLVRKIMTYFRRTPDGMPGNDDVGAMSALYAFSAIGLYPEIPGAGGFTISGPAFDSVDFDVQGGKTIHIIAHNNGPDHPFIQSLNLDGKSDSRLWVTWDELTAGNGATLEFTQGPDANKAWGTSADSAPPSYAGQPATKP